MPKLIRISAVSAALGSFLSFGCIGVSQKSASATDNANANANTPASGDASAPGGGAVAGCPKGTKPSDDGLIDDLEDNDTRLNQAGGRDGYWWQSKDPNGSNINPVKPEDGGGPSKAMHAVGSTVNGDGAWGVNFGANFVSQGTFYDASKYAGITFKAKAGKGTNHKVRFKIGDVNTHPEGSVCKSCWNHFGQDITLTDDWKEYTISFAAVKQAAGWGDPRPQALTTSKLISMDWSIGPSGPFDVWIDDVAFFECTP